MRTGGITPGYSGFLQRRSVLAGLVSAPLLPALPKTAQAAPVDDVGVYAESALGLALRMAGRAFHQDGGARVSVLTTSAPLILAQLKQNPNEDLLVLPAPAMDEAEASGQLRKGTRRNPWHNSLVLAVRAGSKLPPSLPPEGTIAAPDRTPASSIDGVEILKAAGVHPDRIQGVANTQDAAFAVRTGAFPLALVFATDAKADPALAVVPGVAFPSVLIAIGLNYGKSNPQAQAFLDFLTGPHGRDLLETYGLEPV